MATDTPSAPTRATPCSISHEPSAEKSASSTVIPDARMSPMTRRGHGTSLDGGQPSTSWITFATTRRRAAADRVAAFRNPLQPQVGAQKLPSPPPQRTEHRRSLELDTRLADD